MTEPLFFDTDCISAFLWVNNESILSKLFPGRIVIPKEVQAGNATIESIMVGTDTYELYRKLTSHPDPGHKIIGRGEAASISLAKEKQGILASNNLRDISAYVTEYGLSHLTTGDIMKMAFDAGYINEAQGNTIWANMLARKRKLGYRSFSDYLAKHQSEKS